MSRKSQIENIQIHGYPVKAAWLPDGQVVYSCPWHGCSFQTSYSCHNEDAECRLEAYVKMHDHLKGHQRF